MKKMSLKSVALAAIAAAICVFNSNSLQASLTVTPSGTNSSTNTLTGGAGSDRAAASALTNGGVVSAGVVIVGTNVTATTRYTSATAADRGVSFGGGSAVAQVNTNYAVSFSIADPGAGHVYDVDITTILRGSLSALDDGVGGTSGSGLNRITNVNASIGALSVAFGGGQIQTGGTSSTGGVELSVVNQTRNHVITGLSGANVVNVSFNWATRSESPQNIIGGDENSVRLGQGNILGGATPDDYPGIGSRVIGNDGHFVNFKVTITAVPEPSSAMLALSGLVGLIGLRRRRS